MHLQTLQKNGLELQMGSTWKTEIFTFQLQISKFASSVLDFPPGPVTKPQSHFLLMHESNDDEDNDDEDDDDEDDDDNNDNESYVLRMTKVPKIQSEQRL